MKTTIDIVLSGNQIFNIIKDGFLSMQEFDEDIKLVKWIELFTNEYIGEFNEIDGDSQINKLEVLFNKIIKEKRKEFGVSHIFKIFRVL